MTDFGVHDFWKQHGVDRYCVAHESILGSVGPQFPHAIEIPTGVPLMPDFRAAVVAGRCASRAAICRSTGRSSSCSAAASA